MITLKNLKILNRLNKKKIDNLFLFKKILNLKDKKWTKV